jgi:formate-dependent phosphoribosylglycinamide formyltransferase (GAR transformylase)
VKSEVNRLGVHLLLVDRYVDALTTQVDERGMLANAYDRTELVLEEPVIRQELHGIAHGHTRKHQYPEDKVGLGEPSWM